MKNKCLAIFVVNMLFWAGAFNVNADPAPSGESLFLFGYPDFISGAASGAGGAIFSNGPWSINLNPALTANLQRFAIDAGYTGIAQTNTDIGADLGSAFHLGALFPSPLGVWTAALQAEFIPKKVFNYGNLFTGRVGWSRDILKNLYLGASIWLGAIGGYGDDWGLGVDIGAVYRLEQAAFLHDIRFSAVVANMGKSFSTIKYTIDGQDTLYDMYPSIFTPKLGAAALLVDSEKVKVGVSAELMLPSFKNILFDLGAQVKLFDMVTISAGWDLNVWEAGNIEKLGISKNYGRLPFVGIAFNWTSETGKAEVFRKRGYEKSDFSVSTAWQRLYETVQLFSLGATVHFGQPDKEGPDIEIGEVE